MEPQDSHPAPWPVLSSRPGGDAKLFRLRWDQVRNPRTQQVMERLVCETPDWVNVVARTGSGAYVMIRQFRFGTGAIEIEVPGGLIDPGEEPLAAAQRELREETGYVSDRWTCLGYVTPNPAYQTNRCWHFLAEDARRGSDQDLDPGEDIAVDEVPAATVKRWVQQGEITHALCVTALSRVMDLT